MSPAVRLTKVPSAVTLSLTLMCAAWCHVAGLYQLAEAKQAAYARAFAGGANAGRQAEAAAAEEFGIGDYLQAGIEELPNFRNRIPDVSTAAYVFALPILAGVLALVQSAGRRQVTATQASPFRANDSDDAHGDDSDGGSD